MIDTLQIYEELKEEMTPSAAKKIAEAIGRVYSELLNTVTKEEFRELKQIVAELAEAQRHTEQELKRLIVEHRKTRQQIGGLSHTVGYVLEDRAYRGLPLLLKRDFGIDMITPLKRDYIEIAPGRYEEINIIGKGNRNGEEVLIIGECKTQMKKTDIDAFVRFLRKIENILEGKKIPVAVTYQASPPVRRYAEQKGIRLYFSYEMPLS